LSGLKYIVPLPLIPYPIILIKSSEAWSSILPVANPLSPRYAGDPRAPSPGKGFVCNLTIPLNNKPSVDEFVPIATPIKPAAEDSASLSAKE